MSHPALHLIAAREHEQELRRRAVAHRRVRQARRARNAPTSRPAERSR